MEEKVLDATQLAPYGKHQTIIQTYENLGPGESFILQNDHDPKPLYYQLAAMKGEDAFTWDYLQDGPDIFQIRIRKKEEEMEDVLIIDAQMLAPAVRHSFIIQAFEDLKGGEFFILENDHDPQPLYHQIVAMKGEETISWEYLVRGPQLFRIKITKVDLMPKQKAEKKLDATQLPPAIKHPAIIKTFEDLKDGESFILHNDHDPKPLYYQLQATKGDIFDWEYLIQGPEVFEIRITKRENKQTPPAAAPKEEQVLNATLLEPAVKHQTIFKTYDDLKEGESFILENDHDPKPLYYQLSATKGDTFEWEYLQQGPTVYRIRISKKGGAASSSENTTSEERFRVKVSFDGLEETVRTIVAQDYRKTKIFEEFGIDCYWHADKTLEEVCQENKVNLEDLEKALTAITKTEPALLTSQDYYQWDMEFLANYILETHHQYVKDNFDAISGLAENVAQRHAENHPEIVELGESVRPMIKEFMVHMQKEEDILFPAIKKMTQMLGRGEKPQIQGGGITDAILKMEEDHDETGEALAYIRKLTNNYTLPSDACDSFSFLYKKLEEFERDTLLHVHLENNILFPKTIILENKILMG